MGKRELGNRLLFVTLLAVLMLVGATSAAFAALTPAGGISGTVTGDGGPLTNGIEIYVYNSTTGNYVTSTQTDVNGDYSLTELPDGGYKLWFYASTYNSANTTTFISEYYDDTPDWSDATSVSVAGGMVTGIDVDLALGGALAGTVTGDGGSLESVYVYASDSVTGSYVGSSCTNGLGEWTITPLPAGDYKVYFDAEYYNRVHDTDFISQYYGDTTEWDDAAAVTVVGGEEAVADTDLEIGSRISGTVTGDGDPLADNIYVEVYDTFGNYVTYDHTDGNGAYALRGLQPGDYVVYFSTSSYNSSNATHFLPEYYDGARYPDDATPITVTSGVDETGIDADLDIAGTISGTVTGEGRPLQGVIVYARDSSTGGWSVNATTDVDGHYTIGNLYAANYTVHFRPDNYNRANGTSFMQEYYDGVFEMDSSTPVVVAFATDTPDIDATLDTGGSISGTVTGEDGPLEGVDVVVTDAEDGGWMGAVRTDAAGQYSIGTLRTGDYVVRFDTGSYNRGNHTSFLTEYYDDAGEWDDATPVAVTHGTETPGIDAYLEIGGSISGAVTGNGDPLEGVSVSVYEVDSGRWVGDAEADAEGNFTVQALPAGEYVVNFDADYYNDDNDTFFLGEYYDGVREWDDATPVAVTLGADTPGIDADLETGGSISGTVTGSGTPLDWTYVQVYGVDTGEWYNGVETDGNGEYVVPGLPAGDYLLWFEPSNYNWSNNTAFLGEYYDGVLEVEDATPVAVTLGNDTPDIDADLRVGATLGGVVTGDLGAGLRDVYVMVFDSSGDWVQGTWTNGDGEWRVRGIRPGDYVITMSAHAYNSSHDTGYVREFWDDKTSFADADRVTVTFEDERLDLDAQLTQGGGRISGTVYDHAGTIPLEDIDVSVYDVTPSGDTVWLGGAYTDSSGAYDIGGLTSGEYYVEFWDDDGDFKGMLYNGKPWVDEDFGFSQLDLADPVEVLLGETTSDIDAVMQRPASVYGSVVDLDGRGLRNVDVSLWYDGGSKGWRPVHARGTGIDGKFEFEDGWSGLLPGTYKVLYRDTYGDLGDAWYLDSADMDGAQTLVVEADTEYYLDPQVMPVEAGPTDTTTTRVSDASRYSTAITIAKDAYPNWEGVKDVIIVSGDDRAAADPLAASGLCWAYDAPVLLVAGDHTPSEVENAIAQIVARNGEITLRVVGGPRSVPAARVADLVAAGGGATKVKVDRLLDTGDRYDLARAIALRMKAVRGDDMPKTALFANGADPTTFFDALALSPISAATGAPVLLVQPDGVPAATELAVTALAPTTRIVGGGSKTVSEAVRSKLGATRWWGPTRYDTAVAISNGAVSKGWLTREYVGIAAKFPDAVTGGSLTGSMGGVLLLTDGSSLSSATGNWLKARKADVEQVAIYGGPRTVSDTVVTQIRNILK